VTRIVAPGATDAEMAAILIAYEALWPDPPTSESADTPPWRFSGRWWLDEDSQPPRRTGR